MARNLYEAVVVTYRCNAHYNMCDCFRHLTGPEEEITLDMVGRLPEMTFTSIAGGESFIRRDIPDIVRELYRELDRIVISTSGCSTDRIIDLCRESPKMEIHISIGGLQEINDRVRGVPDGLNRGCRALTTLVGMGRPGVGFETVVQDMNYEDLVPLYRLSDQMGIEFATAALHNSFYFRKNDNRVGDKRKAAEHFGQLICELLKSSSSKKWFRAYFNHGLINHIHRNPRLLACGISRNAFFIDPLRDVAPCNEICQKTIMEDLGEQEQEELWNSKQTRQMRRLTGECQGSCWMIGSVSPVMHRYI